MEKTQDGYFLNDPAVNILGDLDIPQVPTPCPPYTVQHFNWKPGKPNSMQRHSFCAFVSVTRTMSVIQELLDSKIEHWASRSNLLVMPRAGMQLNAFYDRNTLQFFYQKHPKKDKVIYTVESPDVVCHETGHGVLDALRPDIWNVQSLEVFAFHEAFADIVAILTSLKNKQVRDYMLSETGGDIRKSNVVSKLAEELGEAIAAMNNRTSSALRDAVNDYTYVIPERLSRFGTGLTSEPHNFSQVFTGAFYQFMVEVFESNKSSMEPDAALEMAANKCGGVLLNGVRHAVIKPRFFESVAAEMAKFEWAAGIVEKVFTDRRILNIKIGISSFTGETDMGNLQSPKVCNLQDEVGISGNPLYGVNVEAPHQEKADGNFGIAQERTPKSVIDATKKCLDYLHERDKVGDGKEFEVVDNTLVRRRICIC